MADEREKCLEEMDEGNTGINMSMLPPSLPVGVGKKVDRSEKEISEDLSVESGDSKEGMLPPLLPTVGYEKEKVDRSETDLKVETVMLPPSLPGSTQKKDNKPEEEKQDASSEDGGVEIGPSDQQQQEMVKNECKDKKEKYPDVPYKEPPWGGVPDEPYSLELLKGGCIKSTKYLTKKSHYLFGRLPNCDIVMEHPSISRYHAIIQYKASDSANSGKGFYLYDLGSSHGTIVNKINIEPKRYYRLRVGYVMKFGGSSRLYILQGPEDMDDDNLPVPVEQEETSSASIEVGKVMTEEEYDSWKGEKAKKEDDTSEGISWGFGEDAEEEDCVNPFASDLEEGMESHIFKDPKKTLRGYFEREGLDLEYQVEETGPGHARVYHCRVKLPIETASGDSLYAEASVTGKKREAVLECATEACRILDMNGLLRQSSHESKKQKMKNWEDNDYYDSDDDTFLDRTGSIEKKRLKRIKMVKKDKDQAETFETLSIKLDSMVEEIKSLEEQLEKAVQAAKAAQENEDSLESYMKSIGNSMDRTSRMQMRKKIFDLKKEKQKLAKLVKISRPASLPALLKPTPSIEVKSKESSDQIKHQSIKTPSAATDSAGTTTDSSTNTRHQRADLHESNESSSIVSQTPKALTPSSKALEDIAKDRQKPPQFAMPALPTFKIPKSKQAPPDGSLSKVLESLKGSSGHGKNNSSKEGWPGKHQQKDDHELNQEPLQKKKKQMFPSSSPALTKREADDDNDDDYSDWTPPSDQSGDGRTKLNDKYGY